MWRISYRALILFVMFGYAAFVAYPNITGTVKDNKQEPICNAFVTLTQLSDSTIVETVTTDFAGEFIFSLNSPNSKYSIFTKAPGYIDQHSIAYDGQHIDIILESSYITLDELTVSTKSPALERKFNKYVFTPNGLSQLADNCYTLLGLTPMLSINGDNYQLLGGTNITIFLNGHEPIMGQELVKHYLKSLPAWRIRNIEIMTNKSFAGNGSIVNIVLDRPEEGVYGALSLQYLYKNKYSSELPAFTLWTNYNRFQFSSLLSYNHSENFSSSFSERDHFTNRLSESYNTRSHSFLDKYQVSIAGEYAINKHSSFGVNIKTNDVSNREYSFSDQIHTSDTEILIKRSSISVKSPWGKPRISCNIKYNNDLDEHGSQLNISTNYGYVNSESSRDLINDQKAELAKYSNISSAGGFYSEFMKFFNSSGGYGIRASYEYGNIHNDENSENSNEFRYKE